MLFHQITVFSQFIEKEISTARNIKSRVNRHNVLNVLTRISENYIPSNLGIFIFAGIDEFGEFIYKTISPVIRCDIFVYNCSNRFDTSFVSKYMLEIDGSIIFASGDETLIYSFDRQLGIFKKIKQINGNLIKRHKKGGQSALRFSRLAEESRQTYTTHVIDYINALNNTNIYIFGSQEIVEMIVEKKSSKNQIINGGFIEFNSDTIKDTKRWIGLLSNKSNLNLFDNKYEEIVSLLETNPDALDFDPKNKDQMKWFVELKDSSASPVEQVCLRANAKNIPWPNKSSKYWTRFNGFEYIGVKYFTYQID